MRFRRSRFLKGFYFRKDFKMLREGGKLGLVLPAPQGPVG